MAHPPAYPTSRTCARCGQSLPLDAFHRDSRSPDGHVSVCRECHKIAYAHVYGPRHSKPAIIHLGDVLHADGLAARLAKYLRPTTTIPAHLHGTPYGVPCLEWVGRSRGRAGVGVLELRIHGRAIHLTAPRVAVLLRDGQTPAPGLVVMHRCDNPPCCELLHLVVGTQRENIQDCQRKGRGLRGTRHPLCKLSDDDVREARRLHQDGRMSCDRIAALYGVHPSLIWLIVKGKHRTEVI